MASISFVLLLSMSPSMFADAAAPVNPNQFLLISSPSAKKVVWTMLEDFVSAAGRALALVDDGLETPKGLAFDTKDGHLYVADSGAKKIFRYTILVDDSGGKPSLSTTGVRVTIAEGHPVEWVSLSEKGDLFYTAPDTNNINMIPSDTMNKIASGEFAASQLQIVSEKTVEAEQAAQAALDAAHANDTLPTDPPPTAPTILSIYESKLNPHVSAPAAIWVDGEDLYWTNTKDGKASGTVVKGQVHPVTNTSSNGPAPFPAEALTKSAEAAFGLGKCQNVMFFTRNGTTPGTGLITGLMIGTDNEVDFVTDLATPRGLVWDKDQTMYVADEDGGYVWSFPAGRFAGHVAIKKTVQMSGAYGLALFSSTDAAYKANSVNTHGSMSAEDEAHVNAAHRAFLKPFTKHQHIERFLQSDLSADYMSRKSDMAEKTNQGKASDWFSWLSS